MIKGNVKRLNELWCPQSDPRSWYNVGKFCDLEKRQNKVKVKTAGLVRTFIILANCWNHDRRSISNGSMSYGVHKVAPPPPKCFGRTAAHMDWGTHGRTHTVIPGGGGGKNVPIVDLPVIQVGICSKSLYCIRSLFVKSTWKWHLGQVEVGYKLNKITQPFPIKSYLVITCANVCEMLTLQTWFEHRPTTLVFSISYWYMVINSLTFIWPFTVT